MKVFPHKGRYEGEGVLSAYATYEELALGAENPVEAAMLGSLRNYVALRGMKWVVDVLYDASHEDDEDDEVEDRT